MLELIGQNKAGIITTIIDKFESAYRKCKIKDESSNIFVLIEESHHSQYGVLRCNTGTLGGLFRDWTSNQDKNLIINDIEDYLYSLKGRHDLPMKLDLTGQISQQVLAIAKRRDS